MHGTIAYDSSTTVNKAFRVDGRPDHTGMNGGKSDEGGIERQ
jgi:hypothetical protein